MSRNKSNSLLQDNSWIKRAESEDETIDDDPNFGRIVLSGFRVGDKPASPGTEETTTMTTTRKLSSSSVSALTKRFSSSQDELNSPSSTYTRRSYSSQTLDSPSRTSTTTVSKDGSTETTITTTTQTLRSSGLKSPTMSETFTQRVKSSSQGPQYSFSPTKTTKVTETINTSKNAEDKLYDTLIPSAIKDEQSPTDSKTTVTTTETVIVKSSGDTEAEDHLYNSLSPSYTKRDYSPVDRTVTSTETVTVKSSPAIDDYTTTTKTRTFSTPEDNLYDTLLPAGIKNSVSSPISSSTSSSITKREIYTVESSRGSDSPTLSSPSITRRTTSYSSYDDSPFTRTTSYSISTTPSDDYTTDKTTYSYSRPDSSYEYSSISSPSSYTSTTYRSSSSRSDDILSDPIYSKSSKSLYGSSDRLVHEKDLCTNCRKGFTGDAKIILDDLKVNCHASCFKCQVCNNSLGHLKAGDSIWVYRQMVHCDNCFGITRDRWRH